MTTLRLLIAEDHYMVRSGLKSLLQHQQQFQPVIFEASNGKDVLSVLENEVFDVILMDITMPDMDGITTVRKLKQMGIDTPVLILSMHNERNIIKQAMDAGASGYLMKNSGMEEITKAIFTVLRSQRYFSNEVTQILFQDGGDKNRREDITQVLSRREIEILRLVSKELTSQDIADSLNISKRTVEGHRQHIMDKLGIKTVVGLVRYAVENELI